MIAWGIIPIEGIRIESGAFSYDSWNWFVSACGIPSLLLGFWLLTFPESPKFMMECGDYDEALAVLKDIYRQNTGDDPDNYPVSMFLYLINKFHWYLLLLFMYFLCRSLNTKISLIVRQLFVQMTVWVSTTALPISEA